MGENVNRRQKGPWPMAYCGKKDLRQFSIAGAKLYYRRTVDSSPTLVQASGFIFGLHYNDE
jgi:hypothetical protein